MRQLGGGAGLVAAVVLVAWLASGFYIVVEGQRGVVLTFGKFSEVTTSGLRWRLPYPVQSHEIVDLTGRRTVEVGYRNTVKTKVLSEVADADRRREHHRYPVRGPVHPQGSDGLSCSTTDVRLIPCCRLRRPPFVRSSARARWILCSTKAASRWQTRRRKLMQDILDRYKTGIAISNVTVQNAQPPEQVQAAFDDAVRAKQDLERQKSEGQAYFNDVVPKASGVASRLFEEANGYRARVVANADGEASRFRQILVEYNKAPQVTRERLYIETVQQMLSSTSKILIDARAGGNLLYLPLDKIMQMSGAASPELPGSPRPPQATEPPAPPESGARSREALRPRERGERQ